MFSDRPKNQAGASHSRGASLPITATSQKRRTEPEDDQQKVCRWCDKDGEHNLAKRKPRHVVNENRVFKFYTNDPCLDIASTCPHPTDGQSDDDHRLRWVKQIGMRGEPIITNSSCVDTLCNNVFNPNAKPSLFRARVLETQSKGILSWKLRGQGVGLRMIKRLGGATTK